MRRKGLLVVAIILMSIGFAAVSTTLIINGNAKVNENTEDYSVIFTAANLDNEDVYNEVISEDKKIITFRSKDLKKLNDTSVLKYEVTNNSSNYDAEVRINCGVKENTEAKYTSIKNELEGNVSIVKAKESVNGTLTVTLNKTATEEITEEYTCTLEFNAVERDELDYIYNGSTEWTFDYTGGEQTFIAPASGTYKLETWGAQGGSGELYVGGYGGYSTGYINLDTNSTLYINVGSQGDYYDTVQSSVTLGGYNGGGNGVISESYTRGAGGGGATHVATISGLLSTLENKKDNILIVSAGGSGAYINYYEKVYASGKCGGGYMGCNGYWKGTSNGGGTQTTGNAFGRGADGLSNSSGGGGGFYGGKNNSVGGAAAGGSSYIGNSSLTEKAMYCYYCTESSSESTKTISTTCANETPTENCAKQGNGYARITLISY